MTAMPTSLKINANKPLSGDRRGGEFHLELLKDLEWTWKYDFNDVTMPMNRSPEPHAPQAKTPKNSNVTKMKKIKTLIFDDYKMKQPSFIKDTLAIPKSE